jgi:POT family proton-dependent oligopeptide transporter
MKGALEFVIGPLSVQALASNIYGLYTGLVYLMPLIGGLLADRLLAIGEFMMTFESLFFVALLTLIIGNGAFKPSTASRWRNPLMQR